MTSTPPRTPSRPHSPRLAPQAYLRSPSNLSLPSKPAPSRSVSQATLSALPPRLHVTSAMSTANTSPTSSVLNLELTEGILIRDPDDEDAEVAESEDQIEGVFAESKEDGEERKQLLRDQLRRTLSRKDTNASVRQARLKDPTPQINEISHSQGEQFPQRQYFVFTDAGKPVFVSRPDSATEDVASITGITSALISVFADPTLFPSTHSSTPDKIRCINSGSTRITFFLRPPLYYICVSKWKEPESVTRMHLEYLHLQIISVLTASQLRRVFERRTNFDLRRLLEGAETFLHTLISRLQSSLAFYTTLSALSSLRLDPLIRTRVGDALVPSSKSGGLDILYAILVSGESVITIARPKKHSVHPTDLHILLNTLHTPSISANPASWLPICLPKFNPQGFVHAYMSFLEHEQAVPLVSGSSEASTGGRTPTNSEASSVAEGEGRSDPGAPMLQSQSVAASTSDSGEQAGSDGGNQGNSGSYKGGLALIVVSGGGEFDAVRTWSDSVVKKFETTGLTTLLRSAVKAAPYGCSELAIPGLRHFLYKSRVHVQATCPIWDDEYYQTQDSQRRLITLYQTLHDAIHAKSGQGSTLKLQYIRTETEAVMGWFTQPFEIYIALSPRLPKSAAVGAANAVARWAKREEARLFLREAPVF